MPNGADGERYCAANCAGMASSDAADSAGTVGSLAVGDDVGSVSRVRLTVPC